jgi:hypothetical protein
MLIGHKAEIFTRIKDRMPEWFPPPPPVNDVHPEAVEELKSGTMTPQPGIALESALNGQNGVPRQSDLNITFGETPLPDASGANMLASPSSIKSPGGGLPPMGTFSITSPERLKD